MSRHRLRMVKRPTDGTSSNPLGPKRAISNGSMNAGCHRRADGSYPRHPAVSSAALAAPSRCGRARRGTETLLVLGDAGVIDTGWQRLGARMVTRDGVMLATFRAAAALCRHPAAGGLCYLAL